MSALYIRPFRSIGGICVFGLQALPESLLPLPGGLLQNIQQRQSNPCSFIICCSCSVSTPLISTFLTWKKNIEVVFSLIYLSVYFFFHNCHLKLWFWFWWINQPLVSEPKKAITITGLIIRCCCWCRKTMSRWANQHHREIPLRNVAVVIFSSYHLVF